MGGTDAGRAASCSFALRVGDVLPFTGDLAAYGANLDRAVKLGVNLENAALRAAKLNANVKLIASEDGQTQASASVEAATKLVKSGKVNVIIGEMASTPPSRWRSRSRSPTGSSRSRRRQARRRSRRSGTTATCGGRTVRRAAGKVLAQAAVDAFGEGATVNAGARNDAFGTRCSRSSRASTRSGAARSARASRGTRIRRRSTPRPSSSSRAIRPASSSSTSRTRSRSSCPRSSARASGARGRR